MQNPASVMGRLHEISGTISANKRQESLENTATPDTAAKPDKTSPGAAPTKHFSAEHAEIPARRSETARRRYSEFLRGRRDLQERVAGMIACLESEAAEQALRTEKITTVLEDLRRIRENLPDGDPGRDGFSDAPEMADSCRKLENLRLETIRLTPLIRPLPDRARTAAAGAAPQEKILLDSLSFRQIFRAAFIASLPLLAGLALAAIAVAAAVIGSFKGLF